MSQHNMQNTWIWP